MIHLKYTGWLWEHLTRNIIKGLAEAGPSFTKGEVVVLIELRDQRNELVFELVRTYNLSVGELLVKSVLFCKTLEQDKIPVGNYTIGLALHKELKKTLPTVYNVPNFENTVLGEIGSYIPRGYIQVSFDNDFNNYDSSKLAFTYICDLLKVAEKESRKAVLIVRED